LEAEILRKRIEEMESLLKRMETKYKEMKQDNEILNKAIEELKMENKRLRGGNNGRR
jgi:ABC-type phosphate transport system auxiliary subunit